MRKATKRIIAIMVFVLLSTPAIADNEAGMKLLMASWALDDKDTLTASSIINSIDSMQLKEMKEEQLLSYYPLRSIIEEMNNNYLAAATALGHAMEILEKRRPTNEYLNIAFDRGYDLKKGSNFKEAGRVVRHALVRGSAIVDSCRVSSSLLTLMADISELQGDTLFANLLHERALQQGLRNIAFSKGRDSTEIYISRLFNDYNEINAMKRFFSRKEVNYLHGLSKLANYVKWIGNIKEAIRLCEQSLQLARDSMVSEEPWACSAYQVLLSAYVYDGQKEKAQELLPVACAYYRKHPEMEMTEEKLYSILAESLFYERWYKEALPYFEHIEKISTENGRPYDNYTKKLMTICKEMK